MTTFKTQSDYPMIPFEEAMGILEARIQPLPARRTPLDEVEIGAVLAEDIIAAEAVPTFDASTMDGYAVIAADGKTPRRMLGERQAGHTDAQALSAGECMRIMTGAPLPKGADAVIPVEFTREEQDWMYSELEPRVGLNIRSTGSDVASGQTVLRADSVLGAAEIGLLAALGVSDPAIYPSPRVAILTTGDELVPQGQALQPGQIRDSNSYVLAAAIRAIGAQARRVARIADTREALRAALLEAVQDADLVISTGGVSMGTHDLVKPVLEELGTVHFGRVAVKPGLPLTFATVSGTPVIGLPGNPVSTLVGFEVEIRPVLRAMAHRRARWRPERQLRLAHAVRHEAARLEFQRAHIELVDGIWWARTTGSQASSRLLSLVGANALLRIPMGTGDLPEGASVTAILIDEPEQDVAP